MANEWRSNNYDDDVWYKGTLVEYQKETDALFDADGAKTSIKVSGCRSV
jgi:hypothetical protein